MGVPACRAALSSLKVPGDHLGFALARLLSEHDESRNLLKSITESNASQSVYPAAYKRWKALQERGAFTFTATLLGPLAIGLGNASPYEIGLTLHQTYGMPVLPGSALKGLCRRMAIRANLSAEVCEVLFGKTETAGFINFWDGWLIPDGNPLMLDTITVHHQNYYNRHGAGNNFPTDFDDPKSVAFVSVRPDQKFLVAVGAPNPEWGIFAAHLLAAGLRDIGLGGKTNAGYGFFDCSDIVLPEAAADNTVPDEIREAIQLIKAPQDLSRVERILTLIDKYDRPKRRRLCVEALQQRLVDLKQWNDKNKEKQWYKAIAERLKKEIP